MNKKYDETLHGNKTTQNPKNDIEYSGKQQDEVCELILETWLSLLLECRGLSSSVQIHSHDGVLALNASGTPAQCEEVCPSSTKHPALKKEF